MNTCALIVRNAGRDDIPALLELYHHLISDDERPTLTQARGVFDLFHTYAGSAILVGEIEGILAASCSLVVVPNLTRGGRPYGLIENVVTHHDFRKRGFGKKMLQAACEAAWIADCYKVMLMTGSKNPETLNFYVSAGFEQSKTGFQIRRIAARSEM